MSGHATRPNDPRPGEVPYKVWVMEEAGRTGRALNSIHSRVVRGKYPNLKIRRVNQRVLFVKAEGGGK